MRFQGDDSIKFEIETDYQTPFIMAICDKKQSKAIKRTHQDINYFTEAYENEIENKELIVHCEDLDVYRKLFYSDPSFKQQFIKIQDSLIWLCISDRKAIKVFDTYVIVGFKMAKTDEESMKQINFVHDLLAKLFTLKVSDIVSILK